MKKISIIFGTRPEAIKLAPVILAIQNKPNLEPHICVTGQHRELLEQVLNVFNIKPDVHLSLMTSNQTLGTFTSRAIKALNEYLGEHMPDMVLVQGDTTTVFCGALTAFYNHIPLGHVEAGLRTGNRFSPYPEEINRVLTSRLAKFHFAPTQNAKKNLLKEKISEKNIYVTGNTVIDALFIARDKVQENPFCIPFLPNFLQPSGQNTKENEPRMILITSHRRENFGPGLVNICQAIKELAEVFPDIHFVYPVHLNPNVKNPVNQILGSETKFHDKIYRRKNIHLIKPVSYIQFIALLNRSYLILTDSGGVQEEAPSIGKPVLVMRKTTERPEGIEAGTAKLVGINQEKIFENVRNLIIDNDAYKKMAKAVNPYGDGKASKRIVDTISNMNYDTNFY
jgi:UDP-N-acetylglucosamine 2-epimerase (non-hydrolysing)